MCGIIGITSKNAFKTDEILSCLDRLSYRGYDSAGVVSQGSDIYFEKCVGEVKDLRKIIKDFDGKTSIAHTRWATTGGVTKENAHPHADCSNSLFVVHNGIIENYVELKKSLEEKGHVFKSETDTEVIAHYLEEKLKQKGMEMAIADFLKDAKGTFAVLVLQKNSDKIYAIKKDSPLVLGIDNGRNFIASDIYAFSDRTQRAVFFEDNEFAAVTPEDFIFYDSDGNEIDKLETRIKWEEEKPGKKYDHYMIKEIREQPESAARLIASLETVQKSRLENLASMMRKSQKIVFLASGTSYHACLLAVYFLRKADIDAQAIIASEFRDYASIDEQSLVIAVSQSGETMDVIDALKFVRERKAKIASVVNVPFSTIQRMSSVSLQIEAGQEVCVAATKTFTNQMIFFLCLASVLGYKASLEKLPEKISSLLSGEEKIIDLAKQLKDKKDIYIIGRGLSYPVAREIALKLKEISYIHAEGMMGGELKHGTLALIESGTPVIALINNNPAMISSVKEAQARGANIISITNTPGLYEEEINIPAENDAEFSVLATIVGQLLTYYIAKDKGLPIDKPRNLAKSCTVK